MNIVTYFSVWGGPRVRKGTKLIAKTYTDGAVFWTGDADDKFPHGHSVTVQRDTDYLIDHKITETCPSVKISNNNDEHRVNVNTKHSANNVKLMVSCRCKSTHIYIQN